MSGNTGYILPKMRNKSGVYSLLLPFNIILECGGLDEKFSSTCSHIETLGLQLVMLFGQVMDPLRGEALLEEMHCWDHGGRERADFEGLQPCSTSCFSPPPKHNPCFLSEGEK